MGDFVVKLTIPLNFTRFARVILSWHLAFRARCSLAKAIGSALEQSLDTRKRGVRLRLTELKIRSSVDKAEKVRERSER